MKQSCYSQDPAKQIISRIGFILLHSAALFFLPARQAGTNLLPQKYEPFDIVINELMVRAPPPVGLPEAEYIELFNRSGRPLNLLNWSIHIGNRSKVLYEYILKPEGYLLITHENKEDLLREFGDVMGLPGFPVLAMGGQTVVLRDPDGMVISAVNYSDNWYGHSLKASGGWSLEQIDPDNPCGGASNWTASASSSGGTPGKTNSVIGTNPDNSAPRLVRATLRHNGNVRLHFSEPMHPWSGRSVTYYHAEELGQPLSALPAEPFFDKTDLSFSGNFKEGRNYTISVDENLFDCAKNYIEPGNRETQFTIPAFPVPNDIIINEILFNPFPGGVNFVELVNISGSAFDLKHLVLAGITDGQPHPAYIIAPEGYLLFPGDYVVLTTDPERVKSYYYVPDRFVFVTMERMPQMNNESGRVAITDLRFNIIDDVQYTSSMHSPLLSGTKGVSLERISYTRPSGDRSNWLSASETMGFATPGYKNSQFSDLPEESSNILSVDPEIFSPDNSGYNDIANITYNLGKPGYTGNITVYDSRGRLVRRLVRHELLGTSGICSWDGRNESNGQARLGIYIIVMELIHPDGEVKRYRETVVLGGRLRQK